MTISVQVWECVDSSTRPQAWHDTTSSIEGICDTCDRNGRLVMAFLESSELIASAEARQRISRTFSVPHFFWHKLTRDASGFFWAGEGGESQVADAQYTTVFRFLIKVNEASPPHQEPGAGSGLWSGSSWRAYSWETPWFIVRWHSPTSWTVLCFNLNSEMKHCFSRALVGDNSSFDASSASSLHASIVGQVFDEFDRAVWSWRHQVRAIETRRESTHSPPSSYESMHELARHTLHSSEILRTAIVVVESMLEESGTSSPSSDSVTVEKAQRDLKFHLLRLRSLLHRSQALEARLQNEINLAFHVNARHDSAIASRIAEATQRDGRVMKAIGILGMIFLPGTFVSAVFSMSFFHFATDENTQSEHWAVSQEFWVYWAVTLPLTALTLSVWHWWQQGV